MKRLLTLFCAFSVLPGWLWAGTLVELPKGASLILPEGISADWALPPSKEAPDTEGKSVYFNVNPKDGLVWLGLEGSAIYVPGKSVLLRTKYPFSQFVWLGSGDQVVSDASSIGRFVQPGAKETGLPVLGYKPVFSFSGYRNWRIFPAGGDNLYVIGQKTATKRFQVLLFGPAAADGKQPFKVLYDTDAAILAAAGDGKDTYMSMGKEIFKYNRADGGTQAVFVHPAGKVDQLEYAPGAGIFYATAEGVGFVGGKTAFEFLRYPRCQVRLAGDSLYILLGKLSNGVLRIKGAGRFAGAKFPAGGKNK